MAARSAEGAVDAYLEPIIATISCLASCTVFGSGQALGLHHTVTVFAAGQRQPNILRLATHDGVAELLMRLVHVYTVDLRPSREGWRRFEARMTGYQYSILDIDGRELAVYDWHPDGRSPVTTPHLHVPGAVPVQMAQQAGSPREGAKTHLGKVHFPTSRIVIEDIADLLIRDFAVVPARPDWQDVLKENRAAIARGRTW